MQHYADIYLLQSFAVNKYLHTVASVGFLLTRTEYRHTHRYENFKFHWPREDWCEQQCNLGGKELLRTGEHLGIMPSNIEQFTIIHSPTPLNTLISVTEAIFTVKKLKT